ncbi:SusC/RagA family TonB-linked outer membrane protein [Prolixibacteraceae bacterium JC049]|nr:SusC/RagA family TonB-linked outer membrane protein [Prolixibacteraceae bacterium JC049]
MNEKRSRLQRMWKCIFLYAIVFGFAFSANAQFKVTGTVSDTDGESLPGVTVVVKGTTNGNITDVDGKYTITAPNSNSTLIFSFVGMKTQEVALEGKSVVNIVMESSATEVDEVTVTALGVKKFTKKIGYAVTEVKGKELSKKDVVNPVTSLQGQVAGVSIGESDGGLFGSARIQIRGSSVMGSDNNQPIFVIDGFIQDVGVKGYAVWGGGNANDFGSILKNLDMSIVESVTVLKGAAATALYGSRGINGAVVITTKGAQSGSKGLGVTVQQKFRVDDVYDSMDFQYRYGPGYLAPYNQGEDGNPWSTWDMKKNANGDYTIYGVGSHYAWGPEYDSSKMIEYYDGKLRPYVPVKDHHLKAYETGHSRETHVSVNGGNEKTRFYVSNTYVDRKGITPGNEFYRNSFKVSALHKATKDLTFKVDYTTTESTPKNPNNGIGYAYHWGRYGTMYNAKEWGKPEIAIAPHGGRTGSSSSDKYKDVPGHDYWYDYFTTYNVRKEHLDQLKGTISYKPLDWLEIKGEYFRSVYNIRSEYKKADAGYAQQGNGGRYELSTSRKVDVTKKIVFNVNKKINEDLHFTGLLGAESWEKEDFNMNVKTDGGLTVPGQYFINNSKNKINGGGSIGGNKKINSVYGLLNFDYKGQVFLEMTGRNDWSSTLTYKDGSGNNSYFYPSVSTSWLVDQTFELPEWMSMIKLRGSWAKVGNDTGAYWLNPGYGISPKSYNTGGIQVASIDATLIDPDVKPEMKKSWEFGLDFRFFQNRLGLDVAVYDESVENQIGEISLPSVSGYSKIKTNVGTLTNKGVEVSLTVVPVRTRDFEWTTKFNYWKNKNEVSELHEFYNGIRSIGGTGTGGHFFIQAYAVEGGAYGELRSPWNQKKYNNPDDPNDPKNGKTLLKYDDGWRTVAYKESGENTVVGNMSPDFEFSIDNTIRWKNLSMSILLDGRYGGIVASHETRYGSSRGLTKSSLKYRAPEYGGATYTSKYASDFGVEYSDGVILDDNYIFDEGIKATAPDGSVNDLSGMTMQEAIDAGYIQPSHASAFHYDVNGWKYGTVADTWVKEAKYIAIRNIHLDYTLPKKWSSMVKSNEISVGFNVRNPLYLYNNLPDNINPESIRGNAATSFYTQSNVPYTRYYTFSITAKF